MDSSVVVFQVWKRPFGMPWGAVFCSIAQSKFAFCPVCLWDGWGSSLGQLPRDGCQKRVYVCCVLFGLLSDVSRERMCLQTSPEQLMATKGEQDKKSQFPSLGGSGVSREI